MKKGKIHKTVPGHGSNISACGVVIYVVEQNEWAKVTCKKCLKRKPALSERDFQKKLREA